MPDNENMEPMLRNALDAVNSARRWRLIGIAAVFFAVTIRPLRMVRTRSAIAFRRNSRAWNSRMACRERSVRTAGAKPEIS